MSVRASAVTLLSFVMFTVVGCSKPEPLPLVDIQKDYDRPLAPGAFALRKIDRR